MQNKKKQILAITFLIASALFSLPLKAQVNIGTVNPPQSFSLLELTTTDQTKGLRLPQLTTAERDSITTDAFKATPLSKGLMIFNITTHCVDLWNGTEWVEKCAQQANLCFDSSTKGTDFWVSFGNNASIMHVDSVLLALKISAEESTDVTLTFTDGTPSPATAIYTVGNNSLTTIDMSSVQILGDMRDAVYLKDTNEGVYSKTLHITSGKPVSVYAFNTGAATSDATVVLPVDAWGKDYYRLSYVANVDQYDFEIIIANQDNTDIFLGSGSTPIQTLSKGQAYVNTAYVGDMTGRHITSSKPVAYFTHSTLTQVPSGRPFADILFEQMMPVNRWGKQFLVPNAPDGPDNINNHIRIIASEAGTTVNYSGATSFDVNGGQTGFTSGSTLDAGQWVELAISGANTAACTISADKPIGVAAYMAGAGVPISFPVIPLGDPSIAWIPPLTQSIQSCIISPFMFPFGVRNDNTNFDGIVTGYDIPTNTYNTHENSVIHYMIIITPTGNKEQTTVNGAAIPSAGWIDNQDSGYSYYYWYFDNTADLNKIFNVKNPDSGVIVLCGGAAEAESYYYNAGSGTCVVNND